MQKSIYKVNKDAQKPLLFSTLTTLNYLCINKLLLKYS